MAKSQESLRFVRLDEIPFRIPDILEPLSAEVVSLIEVIEAFQQRAIEHYKLDDPKTPFDYKKQVTSALRRVIPDGVSTGIVWSANVRTIRFVLQKRTDTAAEEEMRYVFDLVGRRMTKEYPLLFADFDRNQEGAWTSPFAKA